MNDADTPMIFITITSKDPTFKLMTISVVRPDIPQHAIIDWCKRLNPTNILKPNFYHVSIWEMKGNSVVLRLQHDGQTANYIHKRIIPHYEYHIAKGINYADS